MLFSLSLSLRCVLLAAWASRARERPVADNPPRRISSCMAESSSAWEFVWRSMNSPVAFGSWMAWRRRDGTHGGSGKMPFGAGARINLLAADVLCITLLSLLLRCAGAAIKVSYLNNIKWHQFAAAAWTYLVAADSRHETKYMHGRTGWTGWTSGVT